MGLVLNSNSIYLTLNGVNVANYFTDVKPSGSATTEDTTHGAASFTHRQGAIRDFKLDVTLAYEPANVPAILLLCKEGQSYVVDFGPEGNNAGKPRQTQSMVVDKCDGPSLTTKKTMATFVLGLSGADEPTVDIKNGGVF